MESHRYAYKNIFLSLSSALFILLAPCAFAGETLITTTQEYYTDYYTAFASQSGNNVFEEADGTLHAAYIENYELYYLQSTDGGETWTKENLASDHNGDMRSATLTVDQNGYVYIGFTCNDYYNYGNPTSVVYGYEFYEDLYCINNKSGTWTSETIYAPARSGYSDNYGPRAMAMLVDGDNNVHLFANRAGWYTYGGTAWEWIRGSASDAWGSQITAADPSGSIDRFFYDYYRPLVDSTGTITMIMSRYNSTSGDDDYLFYVQNDGTWSGITVIDQPNRDYAATTHFDAVIDGSDHIYLVYIKDLTAGVPQILFSTDFGTATAIYTGESGELIYDVKLHSDAAGQLTLFIRRTDGSGTLVPTSIMTRPVGGSWSSLQDIDTAAPDSDVFTLSVVHTDTLSSVFNEAKLTYFDREVTGQTSPGPYGPDNFYFNDFITSGWNTTTSLPVNRMLSVAAAPGNGYVYIMNGYLDSNSWDYGTADGRSFYALQDSDGSLGEWTEASATIPSNLMRAAAAVANYNGYIYIAGGAVNSPSWDGNVWYAQPGSMGDITEWTQASNSISDWIGSWPYMEAYNGYLYVGGGRNAFTSPAITTRFYYAPINSDGSPGTWVQTTDLPEETIKGQLLFYDNRAYLISGDSTNVYYADITDGAIGAWIATTPVPATVSLPSAHVIGNRIYLAQGGSTAFYYSVIQTDGTLGGWVEDVAFAAAVNPFEQGTYYNGYYYLLGDQSQSATATELTRVLYHQISIETDNDPPSAPTAVSPGDESAVVSESVSLTASAFTDPDSGDLHVGSYWMVRRADSVYGRLDYDESLNFEATSGDLTIHDVIGLLSGMKYIWKVGYVDSGSGTVTWSDEYSFKVGESVSEVMTEIEEGTDIVNYRMMSFPYWLDDPSALSVFDIDYDTRYYRIGHYEADLNSGEYVEIDDTDAEINPGEAMWVLAREGMDVLADGIPVGDAYDIEVPLRYNTNGNGWNQVGCPNAKDYMWGDIEVIEYSEDGEVLFGPTPVSELEEANEYVDVRIWEWADGGYDSYTPDDEFIMAAYEGYWVRANRANVHLVFPVYAQLAVNSAGSTGFAQFFNTGKRWIKDLIFATPLAVADSGDSPPMPMGAFTDSSESGASSQGGCFIATAANGSPSPVIWAVLFVVLLGIIGRMLLNRPKNGLFRGR